MSRILKILTSRFKELSIYDFVCLLLRSLYYCDPILIYQRNIDSDGDHGTRLPDGFIVEKGTTGDLAAETLGINPLPWEFQCHLFDNVRDFFIARNSDGIQHISWIYYHNHHNRLLSMGDREAEVKFCLTLPAARGLGIYPRVISAITDYLGKKGMTRVFMCVHEENQPSIRGIEKAGFHRVGRINLRKVLGFQVSRRFRTVEV